MRGECENESRANKTNGRMHAKARNQPRNSATRRVLRCQNTVLNEVDGRNSETGRIKGRTSKCWAQAELPSTGGLPPARRGPRGRGSGSETQHLPNMKSGTSITRSSRDEVLKSGDPEQTSEIRREKEGERKRGKCRRRRRSDEQEILDSRDAYSQCSPRDFRSILVPCRRVSCINNANDTSPWKILGFRIGLLSCVTRL